MAHRMAEDQSVEHLGDPSHSSHLSSGLDQLRHQAAFCDVTIVVGDQRFPAHKAVLSCANDYFERMFSSGFQESTMSEIVVPGNEESFAQILDFAYTGYFNVSVGTIVGILKMACYMVFDGAVELCAEYLKGVKDELTIEDCLEIWSIASNHSLSDVAQMYRSHLILNFMKCVESQMFLENCSASMIVEILSSEEIETDSVTEEQILQGAVKWLEYDWEQRKVHAFDLLKKIRVGLVPVDRLYQILGDELLGIPGCKELVDEVVRLKASKGTNACALNRSHPDLFESRNSVIVTLDKKVENPDYFVAKKLFRFQCSMSTACYKLTKIADIPNDGPYLPYLDFSTPFATGISLFVSDTGHLYAVGGHNRELYSMYDQLSTYPHSKWFSENNFFRYDPEKNEWIVLPPMPKVLSYPIVVQIDEYIYVYEDELIEVMQSYDTSSNTWDIILDYHDMFKHPEETFILKGNIVTKGKVNVEGRDHYGHYVGVSTLKVYRPTTNSWIDVDATIGEDTYFIMYEGVCYALLNCTSWLLHPNQVYRCICDLDSDSPKIVIGERLENNDLIKSVLSAEKGRYKCQPFTVDKRKLGMIEVPCKCAAHVKKNETL